MHLDALIVLHYYTFPIFCFESGEKDPLNWIAILRPSPMRSGRTRVTKADPGTTGEMRTRVARTHSMIGRADCLWSLVTQIGLLQPIRRLCANPANSTKRERRTQSRGAWLPGLRVHFEPVFTGNPPQRSMHNPLSSLPSFMNPGGLLTLLYDLRRLLSHRLGTPRPSIQSHI